MNDRWKELDVSRETFERLEIYVDLLLKWTKRINLIAPSTTAEIWERHILDSAQCFRVSGAEEALSWLDIGSGGGLPGIVVALMAKEIFPRLKVTLIESDQRKSAFLRTVARETETSIRVVSKRIESAEPERADIISARALADLTALIGYQVRHGGENTTGIYLKGENWRKEVEEARKVWQFGLESFPSQTRSGAAVLRIKGASLV